MDNKKIVLQLISEIKDFMPEALNGLLDWYVTASNEACFLTAGFDLQVDNVTLVGQTKDGEPLDF